MKLYMAVTADKFELPLVVEENAEVLAKKMGIEKNTLYYYISQNGRGSGGKGIKFVSVDVDYNDEGD